MKFIYLFCNFDWGLNFLESFIWFSSLCRDESVVFRVILSKKYSKKVILKQYCRILLKKLQYQSLIDFCWIENVNTVEFRKYSDKVLGIIAGFNQILKENTIDQFHYLVNFHPSVLPLYRGPSPLLWNLRLGENKAGFTVHKVTREIDKGEILYQDCLDIKERNLKWLIHTLSLKAIPYFFDLLFHYVLCGSLPPYTKRIDAFKVYKNKIAYIDKYGRITYYSGQPWKQ